jgi:hypothetical protein
MALRALGCDEAQGFYVSRPQPAEDLTVWLTERASIDLRSSAESQSTEPQATEPARRVFVGGRPT